MSERAEPRLAPTARPRPVQELLAGVAFLTRVPVARRDARAGTGAAAFGVVGAALGAIAAIPVLLVAGAHPLVAAVLALAILSVLDGGLHLDGLADTVDALAAPAERAEQARTDPRIGAAGAVGIILILAFDAEALADLAARSAAVGAMALIVAASASRAVVPAWAIAATRFGATGRGRLGGWFSTSTSAGQAVLALVTAGIVAAVGTAVAGPAVARGALAGSLIGVVVGIGVARKRHGLDGDGYGALIELTVAAIVGSTALLG